MRAKRFTAIIVSVILIITVGIVTTAINFSDKAEKNFLSSVNSRNRDETVVAVVDGEKIYQYEIDVKLAAIELNKANTPEEYHYMIEELSPEEILNKRIRNIVLLNEAKRQGITADYQQAAKYIKESYDMIMAANDEQTEFYKKYIEEIEMTEEEYLKLATDIYYNALLRDGLYKKYCEGREEDSATLKQEFENYASELVSKATVEIKTVTK